MFIEKRTLEKLIDFLYAELSLRKGIKKEVEVTKREVKMIYQKKTESYAFSPPPEYLLIPISPPPDINKYLNKRKYYRENYRKRRMKVECLCPNLVSHLLDGCKAFVFSEKKLKEPNKSGPESNLND